MKKFLINRSFAFLWSGRIVSNFADSLSYVTLIWLISSLSNGDFWLGIFNSVAFLPVLFSFAFGPIIDKHSKVWLLKLLELGQAIVTFSVAILLVLGIVNPILICFMVFLSAIFNNNTYTVQDTLVPYIVDDKDLEIAQSHMTIAYKITDYVYNALVGVLISVFKPFYLLFVSALSFLGSFSLFRQIKIVEEKTNTYAEDDNPKENIFSGFKLLLTNKVGLILTLASCIGNIGFAGYNIYSVKIAHQFDSAIFYGIMNSTVALGTLIGVSFIATVVLKAYSKKIKLIISASVFGIIVLSMSLFTHNEILLLIHLLLMGSFLGISHVVSTPYFQSHFDKENLGKILSAFYTITVGMLPIFSIIWGIIADSIPAQTFLIIFGLCYIIVAFLYSVLPNTKDVE